MRISPAVTALQPNQTRLFQLDTSADSTIQNPQATWSVEGGSTFGTISSGPASQVTYRAPATIPTPPTATTTIRARLVADATVCATATVTIQ